MAASTIQHNYGARDAGQKTWSPEGTIEYQQFKYLTQENSQLIRFLKERVKLKPGQLVLDVGGRNGEIGYRLQGPQWMHIVDPDPTIAPMRPPTIFWRSRVQDVDLTGSGYSLIICSHVLGYLGFEEVAGKVIGTLFNNLEKGGSLILFYNMNDEYMGDLLRFSSHRLVKRHYDFFDESLVDQLSPCRVETVDLPFEASYPTFKMLSRCCWFLFGGLDQDIEAVSQVFLPKLITDLHRPMIKVNQRIMHLRRL